MINHDRQEGIDVVLLNPGPSCNHITGYARMRGNLRYSCGNGIRKPTVCL